MEYVNGGDLFNYIIKKGRLNEQEASYFFSQIIHGIEWIHQYKLCHRDIKPENILLTDKGVLKIIDFGLSQEYSPHLSSSCGSLSYASPEIIQGHKYDGLNSDLWSSGIILYAMICGYFPFDDLNTELLYSKVLKCQIDFPNEHEILISSECKDLIRRMLVVDPDKRLSLDEIKCHPFLKFGNKKNNELQLKANEYLKPNLKQIVIDKMVNEFNYNRKEVFFAIEKNKFNSITAMYKLLRKQHIERFHSDDNAMPQSKLAVFNHEVSENKHYNREKASKLPKGAILPCRIVKTSISSNNSIILDLDNAVHESNTFDQKNNLIMLNNNNNIPSKPLKMNPMLNRLISSATNFDYNNDNNTDNHISNNNTLILKINNSVSNEKSNPKNKEGSKSKPCLSKKTQNNEKQKANNYRYHRNRFPLTSILFTTNQTSRQNRNTAEELNQENTDRQKHDNLNPILIINSIKRPNKTTYNSKQNSKDKKSLNIQKPKPKPKLNTLILSKDIQNKSNMMQVSSRNKGTYIRKQAHNHISSLHSPFKSELMGKGNKATTPTPAKNQYLFSETELNKPSTDLYYKQHTPSKNRLLIIQKPKSDLFALCSSKLARNVIEKNLKNFCDCNKLKMEERLVNSNNCYIISINNEDKFAIEISLCDNLALMKLYHLKGKEDLTKEFIKKAIVNVGF